MRTKNSVFIATSLDGYIADKDGNIDWLNSTSNPNQIDMGYSSFMDNIDALVMGRTTFETVCSFDMDWPYQKPVFVLSNSMSEIPENLKKRAFLINGELESILHEIHSKGFNRLYIDGGATIRGFLKQDLIDEMIITIIPILLGGGIKLFSDQENQLHFKCTQTQIFLESIVQHRFIRTR